jgi:hypothetical protein
VIVLISILSEKGLHHVCEFFSHRKKKAMVEALEKVKAELMVLGFISPPYRLQSELFYQDQSDSVFQIYS